MVLLDTLASSENTKTIIAIVERVAKKLFIPFTVGGGIRTISDMKNILLAGADKIAINTAVIKNPDLIKLGANMFGSQCIVVAIDAKKTNNSWEVFINGGREATGINVIAWVKRIVKLGAGEILLTSMDRDGTKNGYDLKLTKKISEKVSIPVIASGGAGKKQDFEQIFKLGKADAALAASLFHYSKLKILDLKRFLFNKKISMRLN